MIVLDANVAIKLVVDQPGTDRAHAVLASGQAIFTPSIYLAEITATIRKYERAGAVSPEQADAGLAALISCVTVFADDRSLASSALGLSRTLDRSPYDCFYLALAIERGATLITADTKFAAKAAATTHAPHVVLLRDWRG